MSNLLNQGFDAYLPRYVTLRRHARRVDYVATPLFPRYLFVLLDITVQRWRAIQSTVGVVRIVCHGDRPAALPPGIVDEIRSREDANGMVKITDPATLRNGQAVRIVDGPLSDYCGIFERVADDHRVALLLQILGRQVRVLLPKDVVAAA